MLKGITVRQNCDIRLQRIVRNANRNRRGDVGPNSAQVTSRQSHHSRFEHCENDVHGNQEEK